MVADYDCPVQELAGKGICTSCSVLSAKSEETPMTKTIRFTNARLERDGHIIAANLCGAVFIETGEFQSRWYGELTTEGLLDEREPLLLVIPGQLQGTVQLHHSEQGRCDFGGTDAPDVNNRVA